MGAPDILTALKDMGLQLSAHGESIRVEPKEAMTDEVREFILEHKAALLDHLTGQAAQEARRLHVMAMTADYPMIRLAVTADPDSDPEAVIVTLAIRGKGSCELLIPRAKWEPFEFMEMVERHGVSAH